MAVNLTLKALTGNPFHSSVDTTGRVGSIDEEVPLNTRLFELIGFDPTTPPPSGSYKVVPIQTFGGIFDVVQDQGKWYLVATGRLDFENDDVGDIYPGVTFQFRDSNDTNNTGPVYQQVNVNIQLQDIPEGVNNPPPVPAGAANVNEGTAADQTVLTLAATDTDGQTIGYTFQNAQAGSNGLISADGKFKIVGNVIKTNGTVANVTADTALTYAVVANDGTGAANATAVGNVTITVKDVNVAPPVPAGAANVNEGTAGNQVVLTLAATDADGQTIGYTFQNAQAGSNGLISADGKFKIVGNVIQTNGTVANVTSDTALTYAVVANDGTGAANATAVGNVTITVKDVNQPPSAPTVNGGTTVAVSENAAFSGTLSATDDSTPAANLTYSFDTTQAGGGNANGLFTIVGNQLQVAAGALNFESQQTYTVYVRANDGSVNGPTQAITVTVGDVNEAPTDLTFTNQQAVQAGATGANANVVLANWVDPDAAAGFRGNKYAFLVGGNLVTTDGKFTIDEITGQVRTNAAITAADVGNKTLTVVAYDAANNALRYQENHTFAIAAAANTAPTNVRWSTGGTVAENSGADTTVGVVTADDDGGTAGLRYAISNNANFDIDPLTGRIFVKAGASLNFEGQQTYTVTVVATDTNGTGLSSGPQTLTVTVGDVNEAPTDLTFTNQQAVQAGATGANANVVLANWVDPDTAAGFRGNKYAFLVGGNLVTTDGKFTIDEITGQVRTNAAITAADVGNKTLTVVAYDAANNALRYQENHTFAIAAAANTAPTNVRWSTGGTVAENSGADTTVGVVTADDDGGTAGLRYAISNNANFDIDPLTGRIFVKAGASLNFEGQQTYTVTVVATDTNGTGLSSGPQTLTVTVGDVNEAPTDLTFTNQQAVQAGATGANANVVLANWVDPDTAAGFRGNKYAFLVGGNLVTTDGKFTIDEITGQVRTNAAITAADVGNKTLTVVAYDAANNALRYQENHTFAIAAAANTAPTNVRWSTGGTVAENSGADTTVGVVTADDDGGTAGLRYAISNNANFDIDPLTGRIFVKAGASLNFEGQQTYTVTVVATDTNGTGLSSGPQTLTVTVGDVNEAPTDLTFTNQQAVQAGATGANANVVLANWVDPDTAAGFRGNKYAFLVGGNLVTTDGKFTIDEITGQVRTNAAITAADVGNKTLTVVAYDAANNALRYQENHTFAIAAEPALSIADVSVLEGNGGTGSPTLITFTVTRSGDASGEAHVDWALSHITTDGGDFVFDANHPANGSLHFAANEVTKQIVIQVAGDTNFEQHETFRITLSNATGAAIATATATGTIQNDDTNPGNDLPTITVANNGQTEFVATNQGPVDAFDSLVVDDPENDQLTLTIRFKSEDGQLIAVGGSSITIPAPGTSGQDKVYQWTNLTEQEVNNILHDLQFDPTDRAAGGAPVTTQFSVSVADESHPSTPVVNTAVKVTSTPPAAPPQNHAPTDIQLSGTVAAEYAAAGTVVGTLSATDDGIGGSALTYALSAPDDRFEIVGNQLRVKNGFLLDYEQNKSHNVSVRVTDVAGASYTKAFAINVADVNPEFTTGTLGNDVFYGGALADRLSGNLGADRLFGGAGNDMLKGDRGNDVLSGGAGRDTLYGGKYTKGDLNKDAFLFDFKVTKRDYKKHVDTVKDFQAKYDSLYFDDAAFTNKVIAKYMKSKGASLNKPIKMKSGWLSTSGGPKDKDDYFSIKKVNSKTYKLYFDADGIGTKEKTLEIATITFDPNKKTGGDITYKDFFFV
ncbi:cadherin domain-containing protein [Microvirga thermotolerans]|uniref:Cadherin domain-containing protein n=1 Tax=Microvirga thermotolerans TaxID=2651334 RepID=A0A5P9K544_9HYPH|nr:cadherin domain-containing protein [Microvirga thermotolerans]QFU17614.1 hypothetical protein GDR74_16110 [Microvirga thermotolerans]